MPLSLPRLLVLLLCLVFGGIALSGPALAETRVALVIGNGAYVSVPHLDNPSRDAAAVAKTLRDLGFQTVQVETDLTHHGMLQALREFEARASVADWAVVYYAGHGLEIGGVNYLVPVDANLETERDVEDATISLQRVLAALEGAKKLRVVILDACRNNPFADQMKRKGATRAISRGLAPVEPDPGTLVAFAARQGEVALEGDGKDSPFVTSLLQRLAQPGIEINKVFRQVHDDVLAATDRQQEPAIYSSLSGEDFFFNAAPALPAMTLGPEAAGEPACQKLAARAAQPERAAQSDPDFDVLIAACRVALAHDKGHAGAEKMAACDRLASSSLDAMRPAGIMPAGAYPADPDAAIAACRAALLALPTQPRLQFELAMALDKKGEDKELERPKLWPEAFALHKSAALAGYAAAADQLGLHYYLGQGVSKDADQATFWFRSAAEAGNPDAMANLGQAYDEGQGVSGSFEKATDWFRKAAEAGSPFGMFKLAGHYYEGRGVGQDKAAAALWYRKAAETGHIDAMEALVKMLMAGDGIPHDPGQLHYWLKQMADAGRADAMFVLAKLLRRGDDLPLDTVEADQWIDRLTKSVTPRLVCDFADMLNGGDDAGPKNVVEAARLYRVGAESGSSYCMWMLGQRYEAGTAGLPRDLVQARYWYQKAADAGDAIGKKLLDALPPQ